MMVPARNLLRQHYDSYGGHLDDIQSEFHHEKASSVPGLMAEEIPRGSGGGDEEEEGGDRRTSSKQGDENSQGWLRLGIGTCPSGGSGLHDGAPVDPMSKSSIRRSRGGLPELNLFSDRLPGPLQPRLPAAGAPTMAPLFPGSAGREVSMECRSVRAMASSSSKPLPMLTSYNWGQFMCPSGSLSLSVEMGGVMKVVSPPPRRQTGVWFVLQPAQNQEKEPFLPQISKSYLRIKDGRMTVRLLMKYLADKLGLDDETQVVITCRGHQLPPSLTVQYVRDQIWSSREAVELLPDSPSTEHIMTLRYNRSC
ncbi:protein LAX PANICLE 2-like [Phoenix dactylifera]|uniref:Protein LAX PANICLE 2-like n=1 Tax=Phoenix dactylifera TaxID=42345 RepID=A0A8B7C338_PHODC|nr:protein LAX PANICLE 2-like [Phoenix dactylifera]